MKWVILFLCVLIASDVSAQELVTSKDGCYLVYTDTKDRLITGCPVTGYHMNYTMAHGTRTNMYLFRNDEDERGQVSVFFAVSTLDYNKRNLEELFRDDLAGISESNPSFLITKREPSKKPKLTCLFADIDFQLPEKELTFQTMALCKADNKERALLFVLQGKNKETAKKNEDSFIDWINTHLLLNAEVNTYSKGPQ